MQKKNRRDSLGALAVSVLFLCRFSRTADAAHAALSLCLHRILPALFPYMVLSSFFSPACPAGFAAAGWFGGFPVGLPGCIHAWENRVLSQTDTRLLCLLALQTGPAFLLGTVGPVWGSRGFGLFLWLCEGCFILVSGICARRYGALRGCFSPLPPTDFLPFPARLVQAVTTATHACLHLTGFLLCARLLWVHLSAIFPPCTGLFAALLDFSAGAVRGAETGGTAGAFLTGFSIGFSGLSVLVQALVLLSPPAVSFLSLLRFKMAEGIFCGAAAALFVRCFPPVPCPPDAVPVFSPASVFLPLYSSFAVFYALSAVRYFHRAHKEV